ncbi:MAG TPA: glycosyltransferase [Flavobacteriaceae bacterium]|nr:glycosyltransferase [Flavobacteriaceae bacterium]
MKNQARYYSFVIPVYNRPQEILELLDSMTKMTFPREYEVVIVEDGSKETSESIVQQFSDRLNISYYYKDNSGPGPSRNYGMRRAKGDYFIILDSDCLLPSHYLTEVDAFLSKTYYDCFGGADAALKSFTPIQKAINYTMTSLLTTGGIRGNKKQVGRFEPRSFNMGISKKAFEETQGFDRIHPGEDPDLSARIRKAGMETAFIPNAAVYHKRRISWRNFYKQVNKFGKVRPILNVRHPETAKLTFFLPTLFCFFTIISIVSAWFNPVFILPLAGYVLLLFLDSSVKNKSIYIGFLSVIAMFIQFFGYGMGYLKVYWNVQVLSKNPEKTFPELFFDES